MKAATVYGIGAGLAVAATSRLELAATAGALGLVGIAVIALAPPKTRARMGPLSVVLALGALVAAAPTLARFL